MRAAGKLLDGPNSCALVLLLCALGSVVADDVKPAYPAMAPIAQYRMAAVSDEIALARSAAPSSVSGDAGIMTLGDRGYETALEGTNGFVCLVERSWAQRFDDAEFWNPKLRIPICFNRAAAQTVRPVYLARTRWVMAGLSKSAMIERSREDLAAERTRPPPPGAMSFMMSKQGYMGDLSGHWHPHLLFFLVHSAGADWGADLRGSPVHAAGGDQTPFTTLFVLVPAWSDGSPAGDRAGAIL